MKLQILPQFPPQKRFSADQIATYALCSQREFFDRTLKTRSIQLPSLSLEEDKIISQIIQQVSYLLTTSNKERILTLADLQSIVDKYIYGSLELDNIDKNYTLFASLSSRAFTILSYWYNNYFVTAKNICCLPNFPLECHLNEFAVHYTLPLLCIGSQTATAIFFTEELPNVSDMYDNVFYQTIAYMLQKQIPQLAPVITNMMLNKHSISSKSLKSFNKDYFQKVENVIYYNCVGLFKDIKYTNKSLECTVCPYKDKCSF